MNIKKLVLLSILFLFYIPLIYSQGLINGPTAILPQAANLIYAGPPSGNPAIPIFRSLVAADVPSTSTSIDLTSQSTSKSDTTIITPSTNNTYKISAWLHLTTADSTFVILGGSTGVVIKFQDVNSVAQQITIGMFDQTGTPITPSNGNTNNITTAVSYGSCIIRAKSGVAITYAIGFTAVSGDGRYEASIRLQQL